VMRCWPGARCHPIISCFIKIQIGLTFLVPAYPGCPGKDAGKWVSVCWFGKRKYVTPAKTVLQQQPEGFHI